MPKIDHRVLLTDNRVKGIKLAEAGERFQIMDSVVPGFGIRVSDTSKTYILRTRFPGTTSATRREIGKCGDISLTEARDVARKWRDLARKGIDPSDLERKEREAQAVKRATTFAAVVEDFWQDRLSKERRGKEAMQEIRRDLIPIWGEMPIGEITDLHVSAFVKAKGRKAKVSARNMFGLIKRFFNWAKAQPEFGLQHSPCVYLTAHALLGDMPRPKTRVLTDDEIFALWRAADKMSYPAGPAYKFLMLTALRLNEAVDAEWSEFDFREGIWTIPASRMKAKESKAQPHAVPLTKDILAVLEDLPRFKGGKFVFSTTAGKTPTWLATKIKDRLDRRMLRTLKALARVRGEDASTVTLPAFVQHDIRRTVRSRLSRLKIAEEVREAVLAHVRPGVKGVYDLHEYLDEKREALELWHATLRKIVARFPRDSNVIPLRA
jgi:integrase